MVRVLVIGYVVLCIATSIALGIVKPPPLKEAPEETRRHQRLRMRRPIQRFARRQISE